MTLAELSDALQFICQRDGIRPPETGLVNESWRLVNIAYRKLVKESEYLYAYTQVTPPEDSTYLTGIVPVTMPVDVNSNPVYYALEKVYYPDNQNQILARKHWALNKGTLYLRNVDTDGVLTATAWGWRWPDPLILSTDEPVIPEEAHEAIVLLAAAGWMPRYATTEGQANRIRLYLSLVDQIASSLKAEGNQGFVEKGETVIGERQVSIA